jgi:hypothetical protein
MRYRITLVAAMLCAVAAGLPARAQVTSTSPPAVSPSGWSFAVTPYVWAPTTSSDINFNGPRGGTVSTNISGGIGNYLSDINFATMVGAEARYDRFSVMTDFMYFNTSLTTNVSHLSSVNLGPGPIYIPRSEQLGTGTRLAATIWSLFGGYTLLQGNLGNLDAVVGTRMLNVGATTNYLLSVDIFGPNRTLALPREGSVSIGKTDFDGVAGVTGRINIPNSRFFIPFYLDAGGGEVPFTGQVYVGVAYSIASWADVSAGYRYMTFQGNNSTGVHNFSLSGAILGANFHF